MKCSKVAACFLAASISAVLHADNARFDLIGPKIDVRITRGDSTLPIAQVPNLQPGDKIWVKADLPKTQSNHLLLIVAFLRGTTNEPPDNWFTEIDTWDKKATIEGTTITVPKEAEQAIMFVAPETGGDFKTLRSAVKGRPGLFIRSDADLNEASFEQQRIERYLAAMKNIAQDDPKSIQDHSTKLAATLALKPNADCFKQPVDQQVTCLTQSSAPLLLDDGHGQSVAEALSTGATSDFINAAATTPMAAGGLYSAYVGAVVDLVHLVSLMRTAQYQYIPAISFPQEATLNLRLNAPPSFVNPKSVIVIGLPAIQQAKLPPLKPSDPDEVACLLQPKMVLRLQGAPLVFATGFAHDMFLHLNRTGAPADLPLSADAFEGGLIVVKEEQRRTLRDALENEEPPKAGVKIGTHSDLTITGTVRGYWGFDPFQGPTLTLQQIDGKDWKIVGDTQLIAGQDNHLTLQGNGTACVQHIGLSSGKDKDVDVTFKPAKDDSGAMKKDTLDLDVSLKKVQPGGYSLAIKQYGDANVSHVPLTAYAGDIHFDTLTLHKGDDAAVLTGAGLQSVVSVMVGKANFTPSADAAGGDTLHLEAKEGVSPADGSDATVKLKDGRTMKVKVTVQAARPALKLLSFDATPAQQAGTIPISLGAKNEIPLDGQLTFVVQTVGVFPRTQKVEVATEDESVHTMLSLADNNLMLQDQHTAVARLDPLKAFGQSAFGMLRMRPVAGDGTPGDWTPLGVLVRTPQIASVHCTTTAAPTCTIDGNNLFLVQSFAASKSFTKTADVPTGFAEGTFTVPTPADGDTLYLKLRDDADAMATLTLPTPVASPPATPAPATSSSPATGAPEGSSPGAQPAPGVPPAAAEGATPSSSAPAAPTSASATTTSTTKPPAATSGPHGVPSATSSTSSKSSGSPGAGASPDGGTVPVSPASTLSPSPSAPVAPPS